MRRTVLSSIAPFSRSPSSEAANAAQRTWQSYVLVGAAVAVALSVAELVLAARQGHPSSWQNGLLGLIFSGALSGLFVAGLGSIAFAARHSVRLPSGRSRAGSLGVGVGLCCVVVFKGLALALSHHGGAQVTVGTLEFVIGGLEHLAEPLLRRYPLEGVAIVSLSLGLLLAAARLLPAPSFCRRGESGLWWMRGAASLAVTAGLVTALASPRKASDTRLDSTAELALLSSIGERRLQLQEDEANAAARIPGVSPGQRLGTAAIWAQSIEPSRTRPNVLLVMLESVGIDHLGHRGYARSVTPHIDALAEKSVRFRRAYTTATHSNYAQMAVLSSLFPRRFSGLDTYKRLDYPRVLWHDILASTGHRTATYSSQNEEWQGMLRFQSTGTVTQVHHAGTYTGQHIDMVSEKVVPDDVTVAQATAFIRRQDAAFGLYVNLQSTHFPYRVPAGATRPHRPDTLERGKVFYLKYPPEVRQTVVNKYDNALSFVDAQVGRLIATLESTGLRNDTIVVLTADHGELFGEHGTVTHGRTLYEGEARVPLLVSWPEHLTPRDVDQTVSTLDILPTLVDLLELMPHPALQGQSLLDDEPRRAALLNIQGMKAVDGIVCGDEKLVIDRNRGTTQLFDLVEDPGESRDVAAKRPARSAELESLLKRHMAAQQRYHDPKRPDQRQQNFAPRLPACPGASGPSLSAL